MRLFTGLDLPMNIAGTLAAWQDSLRRLDPQTVRWSPVDNLHITTKFLGDWPDSRLAELIQVLDTEVPRPAAFTVELAGVGSMSNAHHGRIIYAVVECQTGELEKLAAATSKVLFRRLGIAEETRAYLPHITLGRAKQDSASLRTAIDGFTVEPLQLSVNEFYLYRSEPATGAASGTVYSKLSRFPL